MDEGTDLFYNAYGHCDAVHRLSSEKRLPRIARLAENHAA